MQIGIIGAGMVGESLGKALIKAGYEVVFSSRDPHSDKMQALAAETGASVASVEQTIAENDIIAVALRWDAVAQVASLPSWHGKIVIDMTNRFVRNPERSAAEELARLTGARVVKAFNTIGAEHYQNPRFAGQPATMFIAGDDADAKAVVGQIASAIGFEVVDAGNLAATRHLENLAEFWVYLARSGHGRNIAFRLLGAS